MRIRALGVLVSCLALPAWAAVETTTIEGTVYTPDGVVVGGGTITCTLSQAASVDDSGSTARVAASIRATIDASGETSFVLIPNDAITPNGTYYTCRFATTGSSATQRASWTEKWSVTTTPDPVDLGSVTRLDVAPGITVGDYVQYDDTAPSGGCSAGEAPIYVTATDEHCVCDSGSWSCSAGGSVAGGDGAVQLSDNSEFAADPLFYWSWAGDFLDLPKIKRDSEKTLYVESDGTIQIVANRDSDTTEIGADLGLAVLAANDQGGLQTSWKVDAVNDRAALDADGDGNEDVVLLERAVQLEPTDSPPSCTADTRGAIYYDASLGEHCGCRAAGWQQLDGGGGC